MFGQSNKSVCEYESDDSNACLYYTNFLSPIPSIQTLTLLEKDHRKLSLVRALLTI